MRISNQSILNELVRHIKCYYPELQMYEKNNIDRSIIFYLDDKSLTISRQEVIKSNAYLIAGMVEVFCQKDEKAAKHWLKVQKCKQKGLYKALNNGN